MARPNAPASLTVTRLADRDFRFTWPAVAGATSYGIVYLTGSQQPPFTAWVKGIKGTTFTGRGFAGEAGKRFAVYATNADGNSAYSPTSGPWYLPVKAPSQVRVVVDPALGTVTVSWLSSAYYQSGIEIERDSGGTVTSRLVGSGTSGNVGKSWVDSPTGQSAKYRVRHFVGAAGAASRVFSAWSAWSNTVMSGFVPPLAPTVTVSNGAQGSVLPVGVEHVPVDGSVQTSVEVRYRLGAGSWSTVSGTTGSTVNLPSSLVAGVYDVQARTKGSAAEFGPWSAVQTVRVTTMPVVTITAPPTSFTGGRVTVSWTYSQAEGLPQSAWLARLKRSNTVLEELSGVGPGLSASFTTDLSNSTAYSVEVVASCGGVMGIATKSFTTAFKPPAPPSLSAAWDEGMGMHQVDVQPGPMARSVYTRDGRVYYDTDVAATTPMLRVTADGGRVFWTDEGTGNAYLVDRDGRGFAVMGDVPAATALLNVYRSIDAGEHWEHVGGFTSGVVFADPSGLSAGVTSYRAVAATALGALATVEVAAVSASPAVWLHNSEGVGVGLRYDVDWSMPEDVEHAETIWFDGDTIPTWLEDTPKSYSRRLQVSATTLPDRIDDQARSEREALKALLRGTGRVTARLPDGDTVTGGMTGISPSVAVSGVGKISVTVTEAQ